MQNCLYPENVVAHLELGQELMHTKNAAMQKHIFVSVGHARFYKLILKWVFLSLFYKFPLRSLKNPLFSHRKNHFLQFIYYNIYKYIYKNKIDILFIYLFVGTVNRIEKPIKNQSPSLSKKDLNKKYTD